MMMVLYMSATKSLQAKFTSCNCMLCCTIVLEYYCLILQLFSTNIALGPHTCACIIMYHADNVIDDPPRVCMPFTLLSFGDYCFENTCLQYMQSGNQLCSLDVSMLQVDISNKVSAFMLHPPSSPTSLSFSPFLSPSPLPPPSPPNVKQLSEGVIEPPWRRKEVLHQQKRWDGRGGRVSAWGVAHMAAALAGCRKALVGTGWTISQLQLKFPML